MFAVGVAAILLGLFLGFSGVSANGVDCGTAASPIEPFPSRVSYRGLDGSDRALALDENVARSLANADCGVATTSRRYLAFGTAALGIFLLWYSTRPHSPAVLGRKSISHAPLNNIRRRREQ